MPGRYTVKELEDGQYYWHAYLGEERVNGGLSRHYEWATQDAVRAIFLARDRLLMDRYYWDVETNTWVKKGTLP